MKEENFKEAEVFSKYPWFINAHTVTPKQHVIMQSVFQEHVDNAVSKTVNLPAKADYEEVSNIFIEAWERGCKGITVYRDGSRKNQVLETPCECNED